MEKISAVYKIVNTVTRDCYVGSSKNVKRRWASHKQLHMWKKYPNSQLYKDMQKYGVDKFRFQILAPVMPEYLKQVEQEFIDMLHPAYNSNRANGWDVEKKRTSSIKYAQSEKGKERQKKYLSQLCSYNGETLTLCALRDRFSKTGIKHATLEAKKFLLPNNN